MNPGKIVDAQTIAENLRTTPSTTRVEIDTGLAFDAEGGLGGGEPSDRYAEGGGTDVVEADAVTEVDAVGVSAVFTADSDFKVGFGSSAFFGADADEFANAIGVNGDEGI